MTMKLRYQLAAAQAQFDVNARKLVALTLIDPERREGRYERKFAQARNGADKARIQEEELLYQLYPEVRPDAAAGEFERGIEAAGEEIARSDQFWSGIPASAGPDGSFPAVTADELLTAPPPNRDGLQWERTRLFFAREAHNRSRLERFHEVRQLERSRTSRR
jgi:hypothetical protein